MKSRTGREVAEVFFPDRPVPRQAVAEKHLRARPQKNRRCLASLRHLPAEVTRTLHAADHGSHEPLGTPVFRFGVSSRCAIRDQGVHRRRAVERLAARRPTKLLFRRSSPRVLDRENCRAVPVADRAQTCDVSRKSGTRSSFHATLRPTNARRDHAPARASENGRRRIPPPPTSAASPVARASDSSLSLTHHAAPPTHAPTSNVTRCTVLSDTTCRVWQYHFRAVI